MQFYREGIFKNKPTTLLLKGRGGTYVNPLPEIL